MIDASFSTQANADNIAMNPALMSILVADAPTFKTIIATKRAHEQATAARWNTTWAPVSDLPSTQPS
jgi:hypothetical protein